jgi:phospholipid/cholesterol/gamma-HCH transport system ATP-binding protein
MANKEPIITFSGVKKAFGPKVIYLGVDLKLYQGETLVVVGGSGTGKSVILKCLIGLLSPDEGSIQYHGEEITEMDEEKLIELRRNISYVFQLSALFDSLTVYENIAYPLREHMDLPEDEIAARVAKNLEMVGLPGSQDLYPSELSGGMKKRIGLARAIASEPEVILWDEPTTGLDPTNTKRISALILKMQKELGVTSMVVTHDMASALLVADRIALLHDKRIAQVVSKEDLKTGGQGLLTDFVEGDMEGL